MTFRELLKSKRYNYASLSKDLGLNPQSVYNWGRKRCTPSPEYIKRMSELLECSTDEVINSLLSEG